MNENIEEALCRAVSEERLSIEVTTHCNSDCLHCFVYAGISERSNLSADVVKKIITEGYDTGYRQLHITGGEPLLWKGLFPALDYAFGIGYKTISLNTNGRLLTRDVSSRLAAYDGLSISVSLEGPEMLHNRLRGEGSYRRAVLGIEKALHAGIDLVVFSTVCKGLLPYLPHFAEAVYKEFPGIKYLTLIQLIAVTDNGFALSEELLDPEDFLRLVQTVALLNLYGLRTNIKNNPLVSVVSKLIDMPWVPQAQPLCRDGSMIIMANRNISLSHSNRDSFGKYSPGMIQRVLDSDEYQKAVAPDETICPSCRYAVLCRENGMIRPSERCMGMYTKELYCKRVLDRIVPLSERRIPVFKKGF